MSVATTLLAFDYGERRIGVAVGNSVLRQAQPLTIIPNRSREFRFTAVGQLIGEWAPQTLVVGVPRHPDGAPHDMTQQARRFGNQLNGRFGLPVAWVDERFSSVAAASERRAAAGHSHTRSVSNGHAPLDAEAARIILQQYFDEAATTAVPGLPNDINSDTDSDTRPDPAA